MASSTACVRRDKLLEKSEIPTITETRQQLGDDLANIVFQQSPEEVKTDLGLEPLQGPGNELWISPNTVLNGKLCFSLLLSRKYVQALTHEGILEIGREIDEKYKNEVKILFLQQIDEVKSTLRKLCKSEMERMEHKLRKEEHEKYANRLKLLCDYYDNHIEQVTEAFQDEMMKQTIQNKEDLEKLDRKWNEKYQQELTRLTQEFLANLRHQEEVIKADFKQKIKCLEEEKDKIVECVRKKCGQAMGRLEEKLETKYEEELQSNLQWERKKCKKEQQELSKYYSDKIHQLHAVIDDQRQEIEELQQEKEDKIKEIKVHEEHLREIIQEFKKFIYLAFKATPTQAEFLLDTLKLETAVKKRITASHMKVQKQDDEDIEKETELEGSRHSTITAKAIKSTKNNDCQVAEDSEGRNYRKSLIETSDSLLLYEDSKVKRSEELETPIKCIKSTASITEKSHNDDSKLLTAKDSVLLRIRTNERKSINMMKHTNRSQDTLNVHHRKSCDVNQFTPSKLALHTDSLEIIHSSSAVNIKKSSETVNAPKQPPRRSTIIINAPLQIPIKRTKPVKKKTIKKAPIKTKKPPKTSTTAKIVGSKYPTEFTTERIESFVNILKDKQSLMRLFTSVTR